MHNENTHGIQHVQHSSSSSSDQLYRPTNEKIAEVLAVSLPTWHGTSSIIHALLALRRWKETSSIVQQGARALVGWAVFGQVRCLV